MNYGRISNLGRHRLAHDLWKILSVGLPMNDGSMSGPLCVMFCASYLIDPKGVLRYAWFSPLPTWDEFPSHRDISLNTCELMQQILMPNPQEHPSFTTRSTTRVSPTVSFPDTYPPPQGTCCPTSDISRPSSHRQTGKPLSVAAGMPTQQGDCANPGT
jgi:hypothetical protein